jgi:hypothetical protein
MSKADRKRCWENEAAYLRMAATWGLLMTSALQVHAEALFVRRFARASPGNAYICGRGADLENACQATQFFLSLALSKGLGEQQGGNQILLFVAHALTAFVRGPSQKIWTEVVGAT